MEGRFYSADDIDGYFRNLRQRFQNAVNAALAKEQTMNSPTIERLQQMDHLLAQIEAAIRPRALVIRTWREEAEPDLDGFEEELEGEVE